MAAFVQLQWLLLTRSPRLLATLFVVPLYAFLTTTVPKSETARTVAANNIVNSGGMVLAALILVAWETVKWLGGVPWRFEIPWIRLNPLTSVPSGRSART